MASIEKLSKFSRRQSGLVSRLPRICGSILSLSEAAKRTASKVAAFFLNRMLRGARRNAISFRASSPVERNRRRHVLPSPAPASIPRRRKFGPLRSPRVGAASLETALIRTTCSATVRG